MNSPEKQTIANYLSCLPEKSTASGMVKIDTCKHQKFVSPKKISPEVQLTPPVKIVVTGVKN